MIILVAALLFATGAFSFPITWTIQNGIFDDGGVANGFFLFDSDTTCGGTCVVAFPNWDIVAVGGNTTVFFPFEFTPANSTGVFSPSLSGKEGFVFTSNATFRSNNQPLQLRIIPVSPLTDVGGTISIDFANIFQGECFNCDPFRRFADGSVTTIPEPRSIFLFIIGFTGGIGVSGLGRFNRARRL